MRELELQNESKERHSLIPAAHLFLIKEGKILLLRRYNTGFEDGNYGVPAGHIEKSQMKNELIYFSPLKLVCT